ncbi:unnamed protein product [Rotaria sp. Silwood2]|nr:unnamed protein product [Rotaria sp. Silwood2]CAF4402263.1 unnamed protein product [Rotaria sp. Silwood2]
MFVAGIFSKPINMVKWEIVDQYAGITDTMRINILSTLSTSIDTRGSSNQFEICKDVRNWLNETYGSMWGVAIGPIDGYTCFSSYYESKYLTVKEKNLNWYIQIWKQTP